MVYTLRIHSSQCKEQPLSAKLLTSGSLSFRRTFTRRLCPFGRPFAHSFSRRFRALALSFGRRWGMGRGSWWSWIHRWSWIDRWSRIDWGTRANEYIISFARRLGTFTFPLARRLGTFAARRLCSLSNFMHGRHGRHGHHFLYTKQKTATCHGEYLIHEIASSTLIPLGIQSTRSSRSVDTLIPSKIRTFDWPFEAWIKAIKRMVRRKAPFFIMALTNSAAVDCRRMTVQVNGDCWWRWRIWRGDQEKDMENPCETNEELSRVEEANALEKRLEKMRPTLENNWRAWALQHLSTCYILIYPQILS